MSELRKLIEAVEAGSDKCAFWKVWEPQNEGGQLAYVAERAFNGSLDAAKALHDALLPGWERGVRSDKAGYHAWVSSPDYEVSCYYAGGNFVQLVDRGSRHGSTDAIDARAWLLSILKAYEAQQ